MFLSLMNPQRLIENFSFVAKPGQTVAIVGKTGAGKSTLVNLLMRFYDVNSGTITIDDYDITQIARDSLRKSFGMVLQDTVIRQVRYEKTYVTGSQMPVMKKSMRP